MTTATLVTLWAAAAAGFFLGFAGYVVDRTLTGEATFLLELFWSPALWAGLLLLGLATILWLTGNWRGLWTLSLVVGTIAALAGAWYSDVWTKGQGVW